MRSEDYLLKGHRKISALRRLTTSESRYNPGKPVASGGQQVITHKGLSHEKERNC